MTSNAGLCTPPRTAFSGQGEGGCVEPVKLNARCYPTTVSRHFPTTTISGGKMCHRLMGNGRKRSEAGICHQAVARGEERPPATSEAVPLIALVMPRQGHGGWRWKGTAQGGVATVVLSARSINAGVKAVTAQPDAPKPTKAAPAAQAAEGAVRRPVTAPVQERAGEGAVPPPPASTKPATRQEKYFAYVAETTRRASEPGVDLVKRAKEAGKISAASAEVYAATYARRKAVVEKGGELMRGVSRASWHATRAAVMHGLAIEAAEAKAAQEAAYKSGDLEEAIVWAKRRRAMVETAAAVMAAEKPEERKKRRTKRETVPTDPRWRERVFEAATPKQKKGVAVLWATGCRPAEIEAGVDVTREGDVLHIDVPGKKITEHSGQPHRRITIRADSDPGAALIGLMEGETVMHVQRKAVVLNNDFLRIRERLRKTGGADWAVSPYSMRHQMSADAKAHFGEILDEDAAIDTVASLMGHRVTRSQDRYGHPKQSKGGGGAILAVEATYEIKQSKAPRKAIKNQRGPAAPSRSDP